MAEPSSLPDLQNLLRFAVSKGVSDIHLKPSRPPIFRLSGSMELVPPKNMAVLESKDVLKFFEEILQDHHRDILRERGGVDFGWGLPGIGRLRINLFRSRLGYQAVIRVVSARIPSFDELHLPEVFKRIAGERRGLILVTGAAGQGKTTTLASTADYINLTRSAHIVTIEDPIEYIIEDRRSVVTQREVLTDTMSFQDGLRAALRQDPDVIVVGEMRDRETVETALQAAETGHLVLSTLHTIDVRETVNRVISLFGENERSHARHMLSSVLRAVVSQRLIPRSDKAGRIPAVEILIATGRLRDLLKDPDGMDEVIDAIAQGREQYGMQTFDQALMQLYRDSKISYDEAYSQSTNPADFALSADGIGRDRGHDGSADDEYQY